MLRFSLLTPYSIYFVFISLIFFQTTGCSYPTTNSSSNEQTILPYRGVDISFLPEIEDNGGIYNMNGETTDLLQILRSNGINSIRLRIWNDPVDGYCGRNQTLSFARRITDMGFNLLLDFHYSDTWADPGHQTKPVAWNNLSFNVLETAIYTYTHEIISTLRNQGSLPRIVQIGNEITGGMLWDEGKVGGTFNNISQWTQFTSLLKSGIQGVHDAALTDSIEIMIHSDRGGDNAGCRWFYNNLANYNVSFDIIGLSFYPWWHGTLTNLKENLVDLSSRYNQKICVVETAYPWTLDWNDDKTNTIGLESQLHEGYPATVQGQYSFLKDLSRIVMNSTNSKGIGVYYWAPEVISTPTRGSTRENLGFFDFSGNILDSIQVFLQSSTTSYLSTTAINIPQTNTTTVSENSSTTIISTSKSIGESRSLLILLTSFPLLLFQKRRKKSRTTKE